MSDMTLTMTFKAVDEASTVMKQIMSTEKEMQASVRAGSEATAVVADNAVAVVQRQVDAVDRVAQAVQTATKSAIEAARTVTDTPRGDRSFGPVVWSDNTPQQDADHADIQNQRDLADQQRRFREDEEFANSLIAGLGGPVPDAVADAITPPPPPQPAWSDRQWGPVEWNDDTEAQAAGREEIRIMRAFADEAEAAAELQRQLAPLRDTAGEIADAMGGIGDNSGSASGGIKKFGDTAREALPNLTEAAKKLMQTDGLVREFAIGFGRVVGSLGSALLVTGAEFAVSQLVGYVHEALTGEQKLRTALEKHKNIVNDVEQAWRASKDAASAYQGVAAPAQEFLAERNVERMREVHQQELDSLIAAPVLDDGGFLSAFADLGPFAETVAEWVELAKAGLEGARELQSRIGAVTKTLGPDDEFYKNRGEMIIEQSRPALTQQVKFEEALETHEKSKQLSQQEQAAQAAGTEAQSVAELDLTVDGAADAGTEMKDVVEIAAEVEPVFAAAATGIDASSQAFGNLDPAAAGAAGSVGASADEIARAGVNAQATAADLERLKTLLQEVSSIRMAMTPVTAGVIAAPPVPANSNMPEFFYGGYTGDMATDAIAGYVHGQEFVFDADATSAIGVDRLSAIAASPEILDSRAARAMIAAMPVAVGGGGGPISISISAPVSITGDAPRAGIEREVMDVMEKSGRHLADIIDEEMRRRERRSYRK